MLADIKRILIFVQQKQTKKKVMAQLVRLESGLKDSRKARCHNCKFAGIQFKIGKLTHLHCLSPSMDDYFKNDDNASPWHSLRVFNDRCNSNEHQFKTTIK
jgi:hypothetical protein